MRTQERSRRVRTPPAPSAQSSPPKTQCFGRGGCARRSRANRACTRHGPGTAWTRQDTVSNAPTTPRDKLAGAHARGRPLCVLLFFWGGGGGRGDAASARKGRCGAHPARTLAASASLPICAVAIPPSPEAVAGVADAGIAAEFCLSCSTAWWLPYTSMAAQRPPGSRHKVGSDGTSRDIWFAPPLPPPARAACGGCPACARARRPCVQAGVPRGGRCANAPAGLHLQTGAARACRGRSGPARTRRQRLWHRGT